VITDGMEQTHIAFMEAGADYIIVKPIREELFIKALQHFKVTYKREM
jgi:two-component system, autoinducer 2 sensor kinase/phosphatase LuxQ